MTYETRYLKDLRNVVKNYFERTKPVRPKNLFKNTFRHMIDHGFGSCPIADFNRIYTEEFEKYYKR